MIETSWSKQAEPQTHKRELSHPRKGKAEELLSHRVGLGEGMLRDSRLGQGESEVAAGI